MNFLSRSERQAELGALLSPANASNPRPLLTHLNDDTSWLLSLPVPAASRQQNEKAYFHTLIEPWLTPSHTVARWFLTLSHVTAPAIRSVVEICHLISDIEAAAQPRASVSDSQINAVAVTHSISDHANKETLLEVDPSVPILAPVPVLKLIRSWKHFHTILPIADFGRDGQLDWRIRDAATAQHLPEWVNIWRLGGHEGLLGLHVGIMIVYDGGGAEAECIIETPHGLFVKTVQAVSKASPKLKTLALLHTTHEAWSFPFGKANLGAKNGLEVVRELGAKYWVPTHDEKVTSTGVNTIFMSDRWGSVEEALADENSRKGGERRTEV